MANNRNTYQQTETVSVKRNALIDIAIDMEYTRNDFRVFLMLLSQLDGYSEPKTAKENHVDPLNFKIIDVDALADTLNMSKKKVKKSIEKFYNDMYLEKGSNSTITNGYRFTF